MIGHAPISKVPGESPKLKENYVKDLSKLTKIQLLEMRDRQLKMFTNKPCLLKLPDKGKRVQQLYDRIERELKNREGTEEAVKLFSELNIAEGQRKLVALEWTGNIDSVVSKPIFDSDYGDGFGEIDPLEILAQSREVKILKTIETQPSLITEKDLEEIDSYTSGDNCLQSDRNLPSTIPSLDLEPYSLGLCAKFGQIEEASREKFKPYRTTISNVHDPEKERARKLGKHWEITAAHIPSLKHDVKFLSLEDSVQIQIEYLKRLKQLQEEQAVERLKAKNLSQRKIGPILPDPEALKVNYYFQSYRGEPDKEDDSDSGMEFDVDDKDVENDEGAYDEEDAEVGGVVNYHVSK